MTGIEFAIERRARKKTSEYLCLRSVIRNSNETRRLEGEMDRCVEHRDLPFDQTKFDQVNELLYNLRSRLRIEKGNMRRLKRAFVANKLAYNRYVSSCEEHSQTVDVRKVEELFLHGSRQETEDLLNYIDANDQASDHMVFVGMTLRRDLKHVDLHLEHDRLEAKFRQLSLRKAELEAKRPLSNIVDATTSGNARLIATPPVDLQSREVAAVATATGRKGRLNKAESELRRTTLLANLREHPTMADDPAKLGVLVGVSESTARRWIDEERARHRSLKKRGD